MAIWFQIAIALNVIYWAVFFYLLARRRWTWAALVIGIFYMLFAGVVSVAPIRSILDPGYTNLGLGLLQFKGRAAALPAALILIWALAAAWIAVGKGRGRWMMLITAGGLFWGLNMGGSLLLASPDDWKFQLGEYLSISGVAGLLVLSGFFALPFIASAVWAASRVRSGGTTPPHAAGAQEENGRVEKETKGINSLRCSESLYLSTLRRI